MGSFFRKSDFFYIFLWCINVCCLWFVRSEVIRHLLLIFCLALLHCKSIYVHHSADDLRHLFSDQSWSWILFVQLSLDFDSFRLAGFIWYDPCRNIENVIQYFMLYYASGATEVLLGFCYKISFTNYSFYFVLLPTFKSWDSIKSGFW